MPDLIGPLTPHVSLETAAPHTSPTSPTLSSSDTPRRRRVAVVVQGCRLPNFEGILRACRETWATMRHDDVDVFFAYGNGCVDHESVEVAGPDGQAIPPVNDGEVARYGDILAIGCSDLVDHLSDSLLRKRLLSLRHLLATDDHDAYLLSCASSYIDQSVLADHVQTMPLEMTLQGTTFAPMPGTIVLSGSAMLMSRDLAQRLVDDGPAMLTASNYRYADDVSISAWVARNISDTDPAVIIERLQRGERATTDNTFIQPPVPFRDYVTDLPRFHVRVDGAYQYHFSTDRPHEMYAFHDRLLAGDELTEIVSTETVLTETESTGTESTGTESTEELRIEFELDTEGIAMLGDYELWVFVIQDDDERDLHRQDIYDPAILNGRSKQIGVTALFGCRPAKYLVWPKSAGSGWGERRVRPLRDEWITSVGEQCGP